MNVYECLQLKLSSSYCAEALQAVDHQILVYLILKRMALSFAPLLSTMLTGDHSFVNKTRSKMLKGRVSCNCCTPEQQDVDFSTSTKERDGSTDASPFRFKVVGGKG